MLRRKDPVRTGKDSPLLRAALVVEAALGAVQRTEPGQQALTTVVRPITLIYRYPGSGEMSRSEPGNESALLRGAGVLDAASARCRARISRSSALAFSLEGAP